MNRGGRIRNLLVASVLVMAASSALALPLQIVYRQGDPAPGLTLGSNDGVFYRFDGTAFINSSGVVSFYARLGDGRNGAWRTGQAVLRGGDLAPDGGTATWVGQSPTINDSGTVAYYARTSVYSHIVAKDATLVDYTGRVLGSETISSLWGPRIVNNGSVLYYGRTNPTGDAILRDQVVLVKVGDTAPDGGTYGSFWRPVQDNAGRVAFWALIWDSGGVNYYDAICTLNEVLAYEGGPSPIGGTWDWLWRGPEINSAGLVGWWGGVDTGISGFFTKDGAVVKTGDTAPNGMIYESFERAPSFNAVGDWIFGATVTDGSNWYDGIFTMTQVIALEGQADPDGHAFSYFSRPYVNDQGWYSFYGETADYEAVYRGRLREDAAIPEPTTLGILGLGLLALRRLRRRRELSR